jgi:hypothetical protein
VKNTVLINCPLIDEEDLKELRESPCGADTEFDSVLVHGLFGSEVVQVTFVILQGIGINAAYDLIKYTLLHVLKRVSERGKEKGGTGTTIQVEVAEQDENGKIGKRRSVRITTSYEMEREEREKAVGKLTDDLLAGKEK